MKKSHNLVFLAVALLAFNLADVVSTWIGIASGKGVEANPVVLLLGGPFSPLSLFLKVVVVPAAILGVGYWLGRRFKDPRLGMAVIIPPAVAFAAAAANNVIVAAKKVKKIVASKG
jgi:hypothetical protein